MLIPVNDVVETSSWPVQETLDCVSTIVEHENDRLQAQAHYGRQLLDSQLSMGLSSVSRSISNVRVLTNCHHPQKGTSYPSGTVSLLEPRRGWHQRNIRCFPIRFESCRQSQTSYKCPPFRMLMSQYPLQ